MQERLCADYLDRYRDGSTLDHIFSVYQGIDGRDRGNHIFYISVVPDIFGAIGLPRKNMRGKYRENHPAFGWRDDNHP